MTIPGIRSATLALEDWNMRHRFVAPILAALTGATAAGVAFAADVAPPVAPPSSPSVPPEMAPANATVSGRFSVKAATCEDFLRLPRDLRGLIVAWTAGRYYTARVGDAWVLDETNARRVIAGVEEECGKAPRASFRYKVTAEIGKGR
jgi:hypothetical protein